MKKGRKSSRLATRTSTRRVVIAAPVEQQQGGGSSSSGGGSSSDNAVDAGAEGANGEDGDGDGDGGGSSELEERSVPTIKKGGKRKTLWELNTAAAPKKVGANVRFDSNLDDVRAQQPALRSQPTRNLPAVSSSKGGTPPPGPASAALDILHFHKVL